MVDKRLISQEEQICNYRCLRPGSHFLCMFSGGKDSGLALSMAMEQGVPAALVHILDQDLSLYHEQDLEVIHAQSSAMNIPLVLFSYKWWHNWDRACIDLKALCGSEITGIVFGDIRLKYIFMGDIPLCEKIGVQACLPIGGTPYDKLIEQIEKRRIISLITKINHPLIPRDLLGKPYSRAVYNQLRSLDIDPFGEMDEFHTTLVDADFFTSALDYRLVQKDDDTISVKINPHRHLICI